MKSVLALCAVALFCVAVQCTPGTSSPPAPITNDASVPVTEDAGTVPDPIALRLCLDNFEQLNPCRPDTSCLSEAQIQAIFCNTPEDLSSWARQKTINGTP